MRSIVLKTIDLSYYRTRSYSGAINLDGVR